MSKALGEVALKILLPARDEKGVNAKGKGLALPWERARQIITKSFLDMIGRSRIGEDELWALIDEEVSFFLPRQGDSDEVRFVNDAFLAYFAGVHGLRNPKLITPGSPRWRPVVEFLAEW